MSAHSWLWVFAAAWLCLLSTAAAAGTPHTPDLRVVAAQPLGDALRALAKEQNLQILFDADLVADHTAAPISGLLSPRAALEALLRGTNLEAHEQAPGVIVIRRHARGPMRLPALIATTTPIPGATRNEAVTLGEILITAERREERSQDVPISVSAYSRAVMDAQGSHGIDDIARVTPGVNFGRGINYNSESSVISIRGIASIAGAATTGVYIDDTPIQSRHLSFGTFDAFPQLFDLDRVEVLRGPQGTLFGSGSEGGTIRFITPEPNLDEYSTYARAEAGGTAHAGPVSEIGVAGGGPLVEERVALRASMSYRYEGGYVDRIDWHTRQVADPNSNAGTTKTARLAAKWAVNDRLSIVPSIYYQYRHIDDTAAWWAPVAARPDPTGGQFVQPLRNGNAIANPSTDAFTLSALKFDWNLGAIRLSSNTSYFKRNQAAVSDYTEYDRAVFLGNPYPRAGVEAATYWAENQENWTQELRLESSNANARAKWTAGLFYQHAFEDTLQNVYDPLLVAQLGFPVYDGGYLFHQAPFSSLDVQTAVFGQTDLQLANRLTLTLGLRYSKTDYTGHAYYAGPIVGAAVSSTGSLTEHPLTPKMGLSFRPDSDTLVYATVAKGYRIGGTNPAVGQFCYGGSGSALGAIGLARVPPQYDADSVWSYEVGTKNSFAEGRALLDLSAYVTRWNDIQQNVQLTACGFQFTANLGKAVSKGIDLRSEIRLSHALVVGATFSLIDAYYTQTVKLAPKALSIVQDGDHIAGSPWSVAGFARADFPIFALDGYARADFQYAARQSDRVPNQDPLDGQYGLWFAQVPSQSYTSLRAGLKWRGLDLSLFAQNLFDTHPRLTVNQDVASPSGGTPLLYVISWRPRTMGLTAIFHYR